MILFKFVTESHVLVVKEETNNLEFGGSNPKILMKCKQRYLIVEKRNKGVKMWYSYVKQIKNVVQIFREIFFSS